MRRASYLCITVLLFTLLVCPNSARAADQNFTGAWAVHGGGATADDGSAIALDDAGNVYIAGWISNHVMFGPFSLSTGSGEINGFVAKLSPQGQWLWVAHMAGGFSQPTSIAVDDAGVVYVTGHFAGPVRFGSETLTAATQAYDPFVAALSTSGTWLWTARGAGLAGLQTDAHALAIDEENVYVTGYFGTHLDIGTTTLTTDGSGEAFVAKLNHDGQWLWATAIDETGNTSGDAIAVDDSGHVRVGGWTHRTEFGEGGEGTFNAFVANLDESGNVVWLTKAIAATEQPLGALVFDLTLDSAGNAYLLGAFGGTVSFGATQLTHEPLSSRYVAKMNVNGTWQWAVETDFIGNNIQMLDDQRFVAGNSQEMDSDGNPLHQYLFAYTEGGIGRLNSIMDAHGNLYLAGGYGASASIGGIPLHGAGQSDVYVAKLEPLDSDQDLLSDYLESVWGTNDHAMDSDGDGVIDGTEVAYNTDPQDANDFIELPLNTSPMLAMALLIAAILAVVRLARS